MKKFYAVKADNFKEIYNDWEKCKEVIATLKAPKYKSFSSMEDAEAFLNDTVLKPVYSNPTAYIDGSYDDKKGKYSFGGILIIDGKQYTFSKSYCDEYVSLRNVAGEIKASGYVINTCIKKGIKELDIYYDYQGIEAWYTGSWKASSSIAIEYQKFAEEAKKKIKVNFHKVKSHTNNYYNDMADKLAKEALGI